MATLDDLVAAVADADASGWTVADVMADLDETIKLADASRAIWDRLGVERSPAALGKYRATARAFPIGSRLPIHSFTVAMELRAHPEKLLKWKPTKDRPVLTVEAARALRGGGTSHKEPDRRGQLKRIWNQLDAMVEYDPDLVIETLEAAIRQWRMKYGKRLRAV